MNSKDLNMKGFLCVFKLVLHSWYRTVLQQKNIIIKKGSVEKIGRYFFRQKMWKKNNKKKRETKAVDIKRGMRIICKPHSESLKQ